VLTGERDPDVAVGRLGVLEVLHHLPHGSQVRWADKPHGPLLSAGSPKEVLAAIVAATRHHGGRNEVESEADLLLGSRSACRVVGMVSPVKRDPFASTSRATPNPTTQFGSRRMQRAMWADIDQRDLALVQAAQEGFRPAIRCSPACRSRSKSPCNQTGGPERPPFWRIGAFSLEGNEDNEAGIR
jgi:hypothetical protein